VRPNPLTTASGARRRAGDSSRVDSIEYAPEHALAGCRPAERAWREAAARRGTAIARVSVLRHQNASAARAPARGPLSTTYGCVLRGAALPVPRGPPSDCTGTPNYFHNLMSPIYYRQISCLVSSLSTIPPPTFCHVAIMVIVIASHGPFSPSGDLPEGGKRSGAFSTERFRIMRSETRGSAGSRPRATLRAVPFRHRACGAGTAGQWCAAETHLWLGEGWGSAWLRSGQCDGDSGRR